MKAQHLQLDSFSSWIHSSGFLSSSIKRNDKAKWIAGRRESPGSGECRVEWNGNKGSPPPSSTHLSNPRSENLSQRLCLRQSRNRAASPVCGIHMSQPAVVVLKACNSGKPFPTPDLPSSSFVATVATSGNHKWATPPPTPAACLDAKKEQG